MWNEAKYVIDKKLTINLIIILTYHSSIFIFSSLEEPSEVSSTGSSASSPLGVSVALESLSAASAPSCFSDWSKESSGCGSCESDGFSTVGFELSEIENK